MSNFYFGDRTALPSGRTRIPTPTYVNYNYRDSLGMSMNDSIYSSNHRVQTYYPAYDNCGHCDCNKEGTLLEKIAGWGVVGMAVATLVNGIFGLFGGNKTEQSNQVVQSNTTNTQIKTLNQALAEQNKTLEHIQNQINALSNPEPEELVQNPEINPEGEIDTPPTENPENAVAPETAEDPATSSTTVNSQEDATTIQKQNKAKTEAALDSEAKAKEAEAQKAKEAKQKADAENKYCQENGITKENGTYKKSVINIEGEVITLTGKSISEIKEQLETFKENNKITSLEDFEAALDKALQKAGIEGKIEFIKKSGENKEAGTTTYRIDFDDNGWYNKETTHLIIKDITSEFTEIVEFIKKEIQEPFTSGGNIYGLTKQK